MYNKKALSKAKAELDKAKAPKKPKDIITDPMGQWKYPGLPTRIPGNDITMEGVGYPVLGVANNGQRKIMLPGADYTFPGADYVDEYPQMKRGGTRKRRKTKSLSGTNELMLPHPLLRNYKNKVYDPNVDYFQDGGVKDTIIYPPGDSEYMDQPSYNYDIIEMLNQKARRGYKQYMHDQTDPTNINRASPAYQQKFHMKEGLIQAQDGGYIEAELTDDEIEEYRKGGYIVEDISVPELNQAKDGGDIKTHKSKDGTITNTITKPNGDTVIQVKTKDGKYYEKVNKGLPQFVKDEFKKRAEWEDRSSGAAQPVDEFWTLPMGMTSAGVKGAGALAKGVGTLLKDAGKSSLAQATKAGTKAFFNNTPKWITKVAPNLAPGINLNNLLTSYGIVEGANAYLDKDSDVRKANKEAYKNPNYNTITDAVYENILNSLDFSGLAMGNKIGKVAQTVKGNKYFKALPNKKLIPSMQFSGSELKNEYVPNTLIHHPDNQYILQNTPVKDFGIKLNIKNIPNKSKHGFDVSENEINQIVNQNLEYLTHPEYIKRRQATTGETPKKIKKEINDYIESLKNTKFDFDKPIKHDSYGYHKRGIKMLGKNIYKPQININSSDRDIKTKYDFLHVLDHEIKHGLSPVSKNSFKAMPKYKNYPHIDLVKNKKNSAYHSADYEQQVRMLRMRDYLNNKYGISKNKELSPEEWDVFANDWNNWLKEEHAGLGNKKVPRGLKDIRGMMQLKHPDISSEDLRKIINKSWGLVPTGITGAALMNTSKQKKSNQMKKGGIVAELTDDEIQDYINQGYIVEEIDEPKMQTGGQLPYQVWQEKTGTPWSEAKRQGLTDGSASANIALMNKLLAGETPTVEGSTPRVTPAQSNSGYEAYDRNVKQMVSNGASLEDLVNIRMGTREGLVNRFPDLFSASNAKSKEINKINIPQNKQTVATKVDTIVNKPDTAKINSVLPKLRHLPESTITRIPAPKVDTPIVKKFEKSKIKAQEKIKQKETEDLINNIRQQITPDTLLKEKRIPSGIISLTPKPKTPDNFRPVITDTNMLPKIDTPLKTKSPKDIIKLQSTLNPGVKFEKGSKLTVEPEKENKIIKEDADYKVISNLTQRLNKFDESLQSYYYDYTNPHHTPEKRKQATQNFKAKIAERNNLINLINSKKRDYAGGLDSWIDESAPAWIKKPAQKMDLSDQVEATSYKLPTLKTFKQKEEEDNEKFRTTKRVDDLGGNEKSSRWQFRVSASNDDPMKVQLYGTRGERNPNLNIKAKGAVMHFLDQSPLTGYMHPLTKDYYNNLKPDAFVGKLEKQKDGNYAVKYVPKKDIPAKELTKNTFLIRQEKFDNIDFSKKVADDNFSGHTYWTKKGTNKATIPVSSAKDANVYDYSSGQSVVFIFPYKGKTRYVHFAGSPNAIKKEGEEIKKQYKLQANKLVLGVADAGSYSSAVKGNITDKKLKDWNYGYANRNSFTGAGMALVD